LISTFATTAVARGAGFSEPGGACDRLDSVELPNASDIGFGMTNNVDPPPTPLADSKKGHELDGESQAAKNHRTTLTLSGALALILAVIAVMSGIEGQFNFFGYHPFSSPSTAVQRATIVSPAAGPIGYCPKPSVKTPPSSGMIFVTLQEEASQNRNCWTAALAPVMPGSTIKYLIIYQNTSNEVQNQVIARINLAPGLLLVTNSTHLADASYPKGVLINSNDVSLGGIDMGNFGSKANAFIEFRVGIPPISDLTCGVNDLRSVGVIAPRGMDAWYNTASIQVQKNC
jgi:uncharacterized repeat protein (TIGR01451 family)